MRITENIDSYGKGGEESLLRMGGGGAQEFRRFILNIILKAKEMWEVQERHDFVRSAQVKGLTLERIMMMMMMITVIEVKIMPVLQGASRYFQRLH